jgi:hypothetical protein
LNPIPHYLSRAGISEMVTITVTADLLACGEESWSAMVVGETPDEVASFKICLDAIGTTPKDFCNNSEVLPEFSVEIAKPK